MIKTIHRSFVIAVMLALLYPENATSGEAKFFVPVELRGLPADTNLAIVSCYLTDNDAPYGIGGEKTMAVTGGTLDATFTLIVRKPDTLSIRSRLAPEYYCRIIISGERPDTSALDAIDNSMRFQLMAANDVGPTGWTGTALGWPGYPRPATAAVALRPVPGSAASLIVRGTVPAAVVALLETAGSCPCGCGATTGAGSACSRLRLPNLPRVETPATQPKPPPFDPYNRKGTTPFDKSSLPAAVTAPRIRFTGSGTLVLASASR